MFKMKLASQNLVFSLQNRASRLLACVSLDAAGFESARLTYRELDNQARMIAAYLQTKTEIGDRVLLAYPAGIDFVVAFMGCLYAGIIAVPIPCQSESEFDANFKTLNGIALDANISGILTTDSYAKKIVNTFVTLLSLRTCFIVDTASLDQSAAEEYQYIKTDEETIAYLQYTTVSSEIPKAVVVRHKNLNHALKFATKLWSYSKKSISCTWMSAASLPGLFFGILLPLYSGSATIILAPDIVRRNPLAWLRAITKYRVTHSGTLNAGYDLCSKEIDSLELTGLDLRSWKIAFNTGENISHETLTSFHKKFAAYGFRPQHFSAAYALSEAVGIVAVGVASKKPTVFNVNIERFKNNEVVLVNKNIPHRKFVSNGHLLPGLDAIIVDIEKMLPLPESKVGEIWLTGSSIADEYWNDPNEAQPVFGAMLPGIKGSFYRTGDLGFIQDGEICFVARMNEAFTAAGKNYFPFDLETTVTTTLRSFPVSGLGVAISVLMDCQSEVVYLQELKERVTDSMLDEIVRNIRRSVSLRHGINLHAVLLVEEHSLPKAANGKLLRLLCQKQFLTGNLKVLKAYRNQAAVPQIHVEPLSAVITEVVVPLASESTEQPQPRAGREMAIIGMNGSFPGAENLEVFWDNLVDGVHTVTEIPASRWRWEDYDGEPGFKSDNTAIQWGSFVEDISKFDAKFFNLSAREAELTDPQQRIFLQVVWQAIEDAGYTSTEFSHNTVGVFVGASSRDYAEFLHGIEDAYTAFSLSQSMIANHVSCFFKLNGPSQVVDTAGSSSLLALHQAIRAIESGDCAVAIVGGVNGLFSPTLYLSHGKANLLSEDGKCKAFDKNANGYVRGEGAAAIIIKPLQQALSDGDHIYGVIKSSAVNHGAHARSLSVPCQNAQADVVIAACQRAEISPETLSYIETNAVGHLMDDAIEVDALKNAFGFLVEDTRQHHYCGLGSVKTNIGHLEGAAGMASLIKVLLAMKYQQLPGSLHFSELNPAIQLTESPFYIVDELRPWLRLLHDDGSEVPRRAGVSAFGMGGTHAHVILEEYLALETSRNQIKRPYLIALSAKSVLELRQRVSDLLAWLLAQAEDPDLAALSYTLNSGRHHFEKRCALVVESIAELRDTLHDIIQNHEPSNAVIHAENSDKPKFKPILQALFKQLMLDLTIENTLSVSEQRNKLLAIGNFYTEGHDIDWLRLNRCEKKRLSLPAYPFNKQHYWVPNPAVILEFSPSNTSYCADDAS